MPTGACELMAVLGPILASTAKGVGTALFSDRQGSQQAKRAMELEKAHVTKPGFTDFGDDLVDSPTISLAGAGQSIFPLNKGPSSMEMEKLKKMFQKPSGVV